MKFGDCEQAKEALEETVGAKQFEMNIKLRRRRIEKCTIRFGEK